MLKDIILVFASIALFGDPVTLLQAFGYSIALAGLIYYKLGTETLKEYFGQLCMLWADFGSRHPAARKLITFGGILLLMFMLLGGLAPTFAPESTSKFQTSVGNMLGKTGV